MKIREFFKNENNPLINISYLLNIFNFSNESEFFKNSDKDALKNDWKKVGDDIRWGIKNIKG